MLTIRRQQMEQMQASMLLRFDASLFEGLQRAHPQAPAETLREWHQQFLERADEFRLVAQADIRRWFRLAAGFDELRQAALSKAILKIMYSRGPGASQRLDRLEMWLAMGGHHA